MCARFLTRDCFGVVRDFTPMPFFVLIPMVCAHYGKAMRDSAGRQLFACVALVSGGNDGYDATVHSLGVTMSQYPKLGIIDGYVWSSYRNMIIPAYYPGGADTWNDDLEYMYDFLFNQSSLVAAIFAVDVRSTLLHNPRTTIGQLAMAHFAAALDQLIEEGK